MTTHVLPSAAPADAGEARGEPGTAAHARELARIGALVAACPAPAANQVRTLPQCHGSGDALLLAALAQREAAAGRALTIVSAGARDAQRLAEEMRWLAPRLRVLLLPDWETLPYDHFSPHQDLVSERLSTLYALQRGECDALLVPTGTALHRLAPPSFLASHTFFFHKGQRLDEARLRAQLTMAGYGHVSQVIRPGEYCVRGGLLDLYPMGSALPYRLDLFGDEIESIRTFDPDSQRSLYPIERVRLLPGREFPIDEAARSAFRSRWRERFEGDPSRSTVYRDVGNGIAPAGIEYWLPLFHDQTATLFDYLPAGAIVVSHGDVEDAARRFADEATQRFRFLSHDAGAAVAAPGRVVHRAASASSSRRAASGAGRSRAPRPARRTRGAASASPCPTWRSTAAPATRSSGWQRSCRARRHAR